MCAQTYGYNDIGEHVWMLLDRVRVTSFAQAISKIVKKGDIVVDIGTGTGILATLAAVNGAEKVYAVDRSPVIELARTIFRENGIEDKIEIIRGDARDIDFPQKPNVVISEMIGNFGIEEDILGIFGSVKKKCTDDVVFIPESLNLFFAPIFDAGLADEMGKMEQFLDNVSLKPIVNKLANRPIHHHITSDELRGDVDLPFPIHFINSKFPDVFEFTLRVNENGPVNAIGTWYDLNLGKDTFLTTGPHGPRTHWTNMKFPLFPPFECIKGDEITVRIEPRLFGASSIWAWEATHKGDTRTGDLMNTLMGDKNDIFAELRLKRSQPKLKSNSSNLKNLANALNGNYPTSIESMTTTLFNKSPNYFSDFDDASRTVLKLLDLIGSLE